MRAMPASRADEEGGERPAPRLVIPCTRAYVLWIVEADLADLARRRRRQSFWAIVLVACVDVLMWAAFSR